MAIANTSSGDTFYVWRINTNKMSAFFNDAGGDHAMKQNYSVTSSNSTTGSIVTAGGVGVANNISVEGFVGISPKTALRISTGQQSERPILSSEGMVRFNTDDHKIEYYDGLSSSWKTIGAQLEDNDQDTRITIDTNDTDEDTVRIFIGNTSTQSASSLVIDRRTSDGSHTLDGNFTTNEFYGYLKLPVSGNTGTSDTGTNGLGSPGMIRFDPVRGFEGYLSAEVWAGLGGLVDSADGQDTFATAYGANDPTSVEAGGDDDSTLNMFRFWVGNTTPNSSIEALRIDRRSVDNGNTVDPDYTTTEIYGNFRLPVNGETGTPDTGANGNGVPGMVRFDPTRGFEGYLSSFVWAGLGGAVDSANLGDTFISVYGADDSSAVVSSNDDDSTENMMRFWIGNSSGLSSEALRIDRRTVDNSYTLDEEYPTTEVYGFLRIPVTDETGPVESGAYSNGVPGMIRYVPSRGFEGYNQSSNSWLNLTGMYDEDYDTKITLDTVDPSDEDHIRFYIGGVSSVQKMSINSTTTYIDTNLRVTGNLQVTGTTSTVGAQNLSVQDNLIYLNGPGDLDSSFTGSGQNTATFYGYYEGTGGPVTYKVEIVGNTASPNTFRWYKDSVEQANNISITGDNQLLDENIHIRFDNGLTGWSNTDYWETTVSPIFVDLGISGNYNDGFNPYAHAGFFYDASDSTWKIFDGLQEEPGSDINISGTGYSLADLDVKDIDVTGNVYVSQYLLHTGDTNNYLEWGTDTLSVYTSGTLAAKFNSANTSLYHNGNEKLYTTSDGIVSTGSIYVSQYIIHSGDTNNYLQWGTDTLSVYTNGTLATQFNSSDTSLYYAGSKKLATTTSGISVTGTVTESSSLSFKENIVPLQNSLSIIDKLQGVSFEWRDKKKFDDRKHIGLIAENVKEIVPEAEFNGTVSYTKLVGLLIEGIKELKKEIEILKGDK